MNIKNNCDTVYASVCVIACVFLGLSDRLKKDETGERIGE